MVHVVSGLLKINKTTRENADSVRERERERERERVYSYLGRKYDL